MREVGAAASACLLFGFLAAGCAVAVDVTVAERRSSVLQPARLAGAPRPVETDATRFRSAAPAACVHQLYCLSGISRYYGVNLADGMVATEDPAASVVALKTGAVDLAVVPAAATHALEPGLTILEDDLGVLAPDHLVLLHRQELATLYGPAAPRDLGSLAESLTDDSFPWLYEAAPRGGVGEAAASWLATRGLPAAPPERPGAPELIVGGWGAVEQQFAAALVVQHFRQRGYEASLAPPRPTRHAALEALATGEIQVLPEYTGSLLEYLNGAAQEASADAAATTARLAQYVGQLGVAVTPPSPASISAAFVVREGPGASSLGRLSDLRGVAQPIAMSSVPPARSIAADPAAPAELAVPLPLSRPAVLGGKGYEVRALQQRLVELGFPLQPNGVFDSPTLEAMQAFQKARGLAPTTMVDSATMIALDRASTDSARPPGAPVIYLTFDDGPDPRFTPAILDLLDAYHAKATFFVVGVAVEEHPGLVAEVRARGHALGNHTHRHSDLRGVSGERVRGELDATTALVTEAAGAPVRCMRPPYGNINSGVREVTTELGLEPVLWHVDSEDWRGRGTESILRRSLAVFPGAVVLLHDGGGNRAHTVEATQQLLHLLTLQGYRFDVLPQC